MKRILLALSLVSIASAVLTGCASHDAAYVPARTLINEVESQEIVVLLDKRFQKSIICEGIQQTTTTDGRMQITASFRNQENRRIEARVNCVFKDDEGFPTDSGEVPFRPLILHENALESAQFIAMNSRARKFTIRVSEPK